MSLDLNQTKFRVPRSQFGSSVLMQVMTSTSLSGGVRASRVL